MFIYPKQYDVIVIGAGHAGIEAAVASARLGCRTLILTQNIDSVGQMSCNPAIGGQAKGQIVREIDALGGTMGINADAAGIHFRILNATKGPSVRSPRVQCDKKAYQAHAKWVLERQENLDLKQGNAIELMIGTDGVTGVRTDFAVQFVGSTIVVTTGTFMRGLLHVGFVNRPGGRMGDGASNLSDSLRGLGFEVSRFKTGTPCRLNGRSIDFNKCVRQDGDARPTRFSFLPALSQSEEFHVEQFPCWITETNETTHEIIRANLDKSPLYTGRFEGVGPRYCPSIEDKVVRFAEKTRHQVFLEPEGRTTEEIYVNGVSTSLPLDVQHSFIRSIRGLEAAEIMRPGYAVEYDFCPPTQLLPTLETRRVPNLYFAGQINGTSGYEEAAAQGLIAGANAALKVTGRPAFTLTRADAYIGVMIDDLVTKGVEEPYRMFTSRAEHRILLRHDNADLRLTPLAHRIGLVAQDRLDGVQEKHNALERAWDFARATRYEDSTLIQWLRRPNNCETQLPPEIRGDISASTWETLEIDVKYEGYVARQKRSMEKTRADEEVRIPEAIDYATIRGIREEARQKLAALRPATLGQAGRIGGVTPADLALLAVLIKRPVART